MGREPPTVDTVKKVVAAAMMSSGYPPNYEEENVIGWKDVPGFFHTCEITVEIYGGGDSVCVYACVHFENSPVYEKVIESLRSMGYRL